MGYAKSPGLQMQTQPGATPQRARASSPLPMQSLHWLCTGMSVVSFVREWLLVSAVRGAACTTRTSGTR